MVALGADDQLAHKSFPESLLSGKLLWLVSRMTLCAGRQTALHLAVLETDDVERTPVAAGSH